MITRGDDTHHPAPSHGKDPTARDAEFLEQVASSSVLELHRSNILRLQMDQMIDECKLECNVHDPNHVHWAPSADEYRKRLVEFIRQVPAGRLTPTTVNPPFSLQSDRAAQKSLEVTLGENDLTTIVPHQNLSKPAGNANVLPTLHLVVVLSANLFDSKDYLRCRYFDKRNLIVWHVAKHLSTKNQQVGQVYWEYQHNDTRKPVLLIVPPTTTIDPVQTTTTTTKKKKKKQKVDKTLPGSLKKLRFRVQILFEVESFQWLATPLRLLPNRCNVGHLQESTGGSQYYNNALLEDAFHTMFLESAVNRNYEFPHFYESLLLIQVWCLKRGLLRNHDGWTIEHVELLILFLYRTKQINARMTPPQVLASFFNLISKTNWLGENGTGDKSSARVTTPTPATPLKRQILVLPSINVTPESAMARAYAEEYLHSRKKDAEPPTLIEYYESVHHYLLGPVFLDPTMTYNYLGRVSPSFIRVVQSEASYSLECLHGSVGNPFGYLFQTNARFWERYDAYLQIPISALKEWQQLNNNDDFGAYESLARSLLEKLTTALNDRVRAIRLLSTGNGTVGCLDGVKDSDHIPRYAVTAERASMRRIRSPDGGDRLILGISINPDNCHRVVDRGPPADDTEGVKAFLALWGDRKAELRRFKDGAIVHAVVWGNEGSEANDIKDDELYYLYHNDASMQGGIVERIVRHIIKVHFFDGKKAIADNESQLQFSLRNIVSVVDSVVHHRSPGLTAHWNPTTAHRMVLKAFEKLSELLRTHSLPTIPVTGTSDFKSRLGIPLTIDAVEPLGPALRYAELFPPLPHPMLGGKVASSQLQRAAGAIQTEPIKIQIRFGSSSKWPSDLKAIGAAKTAMLIQIMKGMESIKQNGIDGDDFDGPSLVTPEYADIGFMGYVFRIYVRADPELKLLRNLSNPSREAVDYLRILNERHVIAPSHHTMVHAVYTSQPSSSAVVRMARRWVASHLLSDQIPFEALELMVCHVYTERLSPLGVPGSVVAGFMRFLSLLATHDWLREPLVVDPQFQLNAEERHHIVSAFEEQRGKDFQSGPPMFIISAIDLLESRLNETNLVPSSIELSFTRNFPEKVVLRRASALAQRTHTFLQNILVKPAVEVGDSWSSAFRETQTAFFSFNALLRTDPNLLVDKDSSSTCPSLGINGRKQENDHVKQSAYMRSMLLLWEGPKDLRIKLYKNLLDNQGARNLLLEWRPLPELFEKLRHKLGQYALFFYNDLCPDVIAIVWRPIESFPFSVMHSECAKPVVPCEWKPDTLMTRNTRDILREVEFYANEIIVDSKVLQKEGQTCGYAPSPLRKHRRAESK